MNLVVALATLVSFIVVLYRVICMASHQGIHKWADHKYRFTFMSISFSLLLGGSLAVLIGYHHGGELLLVGIAGLLVSDRRRWFDVGGGNDIAKQR